MKHLMATAIAFTLGSASQAAAFSCPGEDAVKAAVEAYIQNDYWSPGQREIWKIKDVGAFAFGPITFGKVIKKDMDYSGKREVCPARFTYSFTVTREDGSTETTRLGEGQTHYFYQDDFGAWTFKSG